MMFKVVLSRKAEKDLFSLGKKNRLKIENILISLSMDPFLGKKLSGNLSGLFSARVWPYKIIYEIKKESLVVLVIRIGHRQGVYKI